MTVFLPSGTLTTIAPLVSKDKGSMGNRINCAGSQLLNVAGTTAGVVGTVYATDFAFKHTKGIANGISNLGTKLQNIELPESVKNFLTKRLDKLMDSSLIKKLGNLIGKAQPLFEKGQGFITKTKDLFAKMPKGGKYALAGALALTILSGVYRSGQIDQKHTDRAKMEKNVV